MKEKNSKAIHYSTRSSRTKPAEVRLDELMSAAEELFMSKGVEATTIDEIVEAAGVAKGTFYHYFRSKNDMLEALGNRYTERFLSTVQKAVEACSPDDWHEKLRVWVQANVETYVKTFRTHDMVYVNHHHHNRDNSAKNAILDQLIGIIEGGGSAGVWAVDHPRTTALLIYSGVHGATDDIIAAKSRRVTSFARNLSDICLRLLTFTE